MNVRFVAEVSSNHNRDLERCLEFIDRSAQIGCSAVKFQLFKIRKLFAPEILKKSELHRKREQWELPLEFLPYLAQHCHEKNLQFACTPFYLEAVEELKPYVDFYKIASYELMWHDLLMACAKTQKPVVISTGMATLPEISAAVKALSNAGCQNPLLLHCVSGYPAPAKECNLAAMQTMQNLYNLSVGWSDHSVEPGVILRAVHRYGASLVEFHLDLDGNGEEYRTGHCWLPEQIGPVISAIRQGLDADGSGEKGPAPSELADRMWRADPSDGLRPLLAIREKWNL